MVEKYLGGTMSTEPKNDSSAAQLVELQASVDKDLQTLKQTREALQSKTEAALKLLDKVREEASRERIKFCWLQEAASAKRKPRVQEIRKMWLIRNSFGDGVVSTAPSSYPPSIVEGQINQILGAIEWNVKLTANAQDAIKKLRDITATWKGYEEPISK
jgi:hypothetical protein